MKAAPSSIVAGIVINQVTIISLAVDHRTAEKRLEEPTPMMEEEITWVVLTGAPNDVIT